MVVRAKKRAEGSEFIEIKEPKYRKISRVDSFSELDDVLKNSFANIKKDMLSLNESQHQQMIKLAELRQKFKDAKTEFVTIDKFNVLKIKIGEINENLKKMWDLDTKITNLDDHKLSEEEFERQASKWEDSFDDIRTNIDEIKTKSATNKQVQNLVEDVNDEFDKVKANIQELSSIKDTIKKREIDKVKAKLKLIDDEISRTVEKNQVENLIEDINIEFDNVKDLVQDIKEDTESKVEKHLFNFDKKLESFKEKLVDFKKHSKEFIEKKKVQKHVDNINEELDDIRDELNEKFDLIEKLRKKTVSAEEFKAFENEVREFKKDAVRKDQAEEFLEDINNEFDDIRAKLKGSAQDLQDLKKSMNSRFDAKIDRREYEDDIADVQDQIEELADTVEELNSGMIRSKEVKRMRDLFEKEIRSIKKELNQNGKEYERELDKLFAQNEKLEKKASKIVYVKKARAARASWWSRDKKPKKSKLKKVKAKKGKKVKVKERKAKKVKPKKAKARREWNKLPLFGNIFIGGAFALLIIAIIVFFMGLVNVTDILAIVAVGVFVIGIVLRVVHVLRND